LVGKIERRPGEDLGMEDIKMVLQNIGWQSVYLIHMAQDREKWRTPGNMLMGTSVA
jgi:hypothetical protein